MDRKKKDLIYLLVFILTLVIFLVIYFFVDKIELVSEKDMDKLKEDEVFDQEIMAITNIDSLYNLLENESDMINSVSNYVRQMFMIDMYVLKSYTNVDENFYNENEIIMNDGFGVRNYNEFKNLYDYVSNYEENIIKISIIKESIMKIDQKIEFDLEIKFATNNTKKFKLTLTDYTSNDTFNMLISPSYN